MKRLRTTDGTPIHRRAARYHAAKCKTGGTPLHAALRAEVIARHADLVMKSRTAEDADDAMVEAGAEVDAAELKLENAVRDLDAALAKLDRASPERNARAAVFPAGFGAVIDPEGDAQLAVLPALKSRLAPFAADLPEPIAQLDATEGALRAALAAVDLAEAKRDATFAEELAARQAVREQLESAHGRLRDFYKARPALAEQFFAAEGYARKPLKGAPPVAPAPAPAPSPATEPATPPAPPDGPASTPG